MSKNYAIKDVLEIDRVVRAFLMQWSEIFPPNEEYYYHHTFLDSPLGRFRIEWKRWKYPDEYYELYLVEKDKEANTVEKYLGYYCDLSDAKKAAESYINKVDHREILESAPRNPPTHIFAVNYNILQLKHGCTIPYPLYPSLWQ